MVQVPALALGLLHDRAVPWARQERAVERGAAQGAQEMARSYLVGSDKEQVHALLRPRKQMMAHCQEVVAAHDQETALWCKRVVGMVPLSSAVDAARHVSAVDLDEGSRGARFLPVDTLEALALGADSLELEETACQEISANQEVALEALREVGEEASLDIALGVFQEA